MKDIFISYKSEDIAAARKVRDHLENEGLSVWMAPDSIRGGASYAAEIPPAIENCKVLVLILSEKTQSSKWVSRELDQAINDDKMIMPFMIENCQLTHEFRFYLTNVQRYEAYENYDKSLIRMTGEIKRYLAPPKQEEEPKKPPVKPKPPKPKAKKEKKEKAVANPEEREKKRNKLFVIGCILLLAVAVFLIVRDSNRIEIAGEVLTKNSTNVFLYKKQISFGEINSINMMDERKLVSLEECTVDAEDLSKLGHSAKTLIIKNCNLTKEQIATLDFSKNQLNSLDLSGSELDSLDFLKGQEESLYSLKINDTKVKDISILSNFTNLSHFEANNCQIADISALANCEKLDTLKLAGNEIETITPLENLEKITSIDVSSNKLKNLDGLEKCLYLTKVSADNNEIENINGLANATKLYLVSLNGNNISDISILPKSAETLQRVYLADNAVSDPSPLAECPEIRYLNLAGNDITDVSWAGNLKSLDAFELSDNNLEGKLTLADMPGLTYLVLSNNKLTGFEGKLKIDTNALLALDGNQLTSLDVDYTGTYRMILLGNTGLEDFDSVYKAKGRTILDYSEKLDLDKLKAAGYSQITLVGVPLDRQIAVKEALGYVEFADKLEYDVKANLPQEMYGE